MQIFLARACILLNFDTFFPISVAILLSSSLSLALFLLLPYSLPPFPLLSSKSEVIFLFSLVNPLLIPCIYRQSPDGEPTVNRQSRIG